MPTIGSSVANASPRAIWTPTSRAPESPGRLVTAMPARSPSATPARESAVSITGRAFFKWSREASSGTIPPYGACTRIWLSITSLRTQPRSSTTAAAVSSHEVSMPRTSNGTSGGLEAAAFIPARQREQRKPGPRLRLSLGGRQRGRLQHAHLDVVVPHQRHDREHRALTGRVRPREEVVVAPVAELERRQRVVIELGDGPQRGAVEQRHALGLARPVHTVLVVGGDVADDHGLRRAGLVGRVAVGAGGALPQRVDVEPHAHPQGGWYAVRQDAFVERGRADHRPAVGRVAVGVEAVERGTAEAARRAERDRKERDGQPHGAGAGSLSNACALFLTRGSGSAPLACVSVRRAASGAARCSARKAASRTSAVSSPRAVFSRASRARRGSPFLIRRPSVSTATVRRLQSGRDSKAVTGSAAAACRASRLDSTA